MSTLLRTWLSLLLGCSIASSLKAPGAAIYRTHIRRAFAGTAPYAAVVVGQRFTVPHCENNLTVTFQPFGSRAQLANCQLQPDIPGDYVVAESAQGMSAVRIRAAANVNSVDTVYIRDNFHPTATSGASDTAVNTWLPSNCASRQPAGRLQLPAGCALQSAQLISHFYEPLRLQLDNVTLASAASSIRINVSYASISPQDRPWQGVFLLLKASGHLTINASDADAQTQWQAAKLDLPPPGQPFTLHLIVSGRNGNVTILQPGPYALIPHHLVDTRLLGDGTGMASLSLQAVEDNVSLTGLTASVYRSADQPRGPADIYPLESQPICSSNVTIGPWLGQLHADNVALGILDVTLPPFSVDNTGAADVTEALNAATTFAMRHHLISFLPNGTYTLTDTLNLTQHSSYQPSVNRGTSYVVRGDQRSGAASILRLAPNSPGFANPQKPKVFVLLQNINDADEIQSNINMNQVLQGLTIAVDGNNPGAVAVAAGGAQGTGLEDVIIEAGSALVGLAGASGSGGAHHNVVIHGGAFGADLRLARPMSTITSLVMSGQRCAGLVVAGIAPLVVVGFNITDTAGGAHYVPISAGLCSVNALYIGGCWLPPLPIGEDCGAAFSGQTALIDGVIDSVSAVPRPVAAQMNSSLYLKNVAVRGFEILAQLNGTHEFWGRGLDPQVWLNISEAAAAQPSAPVERDGVLYQYQRQLYLDGANSSQSIFVAHNSTVPPPPDLLSRHQWGSPSAFPSFQTPYVNARDYGAVGDGYADDTAALETAMAAAMAADHKTLFLPPGAYAVNRSLTVPDGGRLIGTAHTFTLIVPHWPPSGQHFALVTIGSGRPTVGNGDTTTTGLGSVLFGVSMIAWREIPEVSGLHWQTSLDRSVFRRCATWIRPGPCGVARPPAGCPAALSPNHTDPMILIDGNVWTAGKRRG